MTLINNSSRLIIYHLTYSVWVQIQLELEIVCQHMREYVNLNLPAVRTQADYWSFYCVTPQPTSTWNKIRYFIDLWFKHGRLRRENGFSLCVHTWCSVSHRNVDVVIRVVCEYKAVKGSWMTPSQITSCQALSVCRCFSGRCVVSPSNQRCGAAHLNATGQSG